MKEFWVDFTASVKVMAETEEEAKEKMLAELPTQYEFVEVDCIEEREED